MAVAAVLALPAQAIAGDNCSTTDPTDVAVLHADQGDRQRQPPRARSSVQGASSSSGSLPFTGLDVISLLAIAAALTGAGLVLRRLTIGGGERSS